MVSYDTGVRDAFGLKDNDFQNKARFLLGQDTYASLMGGSNGTLMLMARTSPILVTDQQVSAAISNISKFSPYHAENILRVTLDLGLLFINADGSEAESSAAPEAGYTIQLPIPKEMQDVKLIAVAATNEDAIATPVEVTIENGSIRFDTKYLSTFTILGFSEAKSGSISKTPTVAVVLIVVGALMLIGAVLLFYFFVLRRPGGGNGDGTGTGPDGSRAAGRFRSAAGRRTRRFAAANCATQAGHGGHLQFRQPPSAAAGSPAFPAACRAALRSAAGRWCLSDPSRIFRGTGNRPVCQSTV